MAVITDRETFKNSWAGRRATGPSNWPRVLYVDDDPNVVSSMERFFHRYRVRLECAYHGMQGIWLAATDRPSLIITDLAMPLASGEELIDCLAAHPATRNTPIIVLSGRSNLRLTAKLKAAGVANVFQKPIAFEQLKDAVARILPLQERAAAS